MKLPLERFRGGRTGGLAARWSRDAAAAARRAAGEVRSMVSGEDGRPELASPGFSGLHWMTAGLFLASGFEAALARTEDTPTGAARRPETDPVRSALGAASRAPLFAAPVAAVAHVARAVRPGGTPGPVLRALDNVAVTAAGLAIAAGAYRVWRERRDGAGETGAARPGLARWLPALAPLGLAATGALGLLLERGERRDAALHRRLERRASIVERLLSPRRARVDRIIIRV